MSGEVEILKTQLAEVERERDRIKEAIHVNMRAEEDIERPFRRRIDELSNEKLIEKTLREQAEAALTAMTQERDDYKALSINEGLRALRESDRANEAEGRSVRMLEAYEQQQEQAVKAGEACLAAEAQLTAARAEVEALERQYDEKCRWADACANETGDLRSAIVDALQIPYDRVLPDDHVLVAALTAARARIEALEALLAKAAPYSCPECGPHVRVDEDECCASCGHAAYRTSPPATGHDAGV